MKYVDDIHSILSSCKQTKRLIFHHQFHDALHLVHLHTMYIDHLTLDDKEVISTLNSLLDMTLDCLFSISFKLTFYLFYTRQSKKNDRNPSFSWSCSNCNQLTCIFKESSTWIIWKKIWKQSPRMHDFSWMNSSFIISFRIYVLDCYISLLEIMMWRCGRGVIQKRRWKDY